MERCCAAPPAAPRQPFLHARRGDGARTGFAPGAGMADAPSPAHPRRSTARGTGRPVTPGDGGIHAFRVNGDGTLTALPQASVTGTLPVSVTGLAAY